MTQVRSYILATNIRFISIIIGIIVALSVTLIMSLPYVWAGLVTVGLILCVLSLIAKDFKAYWLAIFALALPLEIKKLLVDSELIREITLINGIPLGEIPAPVIYLSDLPFIVLMIHWLLQIVSRKQKIFFPKSNWWALAFLMWASLSFINAQVLSYALFDFARLFKFYLLYLYIANNIRSMDTLNTLMKFLLIGVIFQGLICLYQFFGQDIGYIFGDLFGQKDLYTNEAIEKYGTFFNVNEGTGALKRASGTVGPINAEAQYFQFLLPVAFLLWFTAQKARGIFLNISASVLGSLGMIVTFSRGGLIGLSVGMLTVFFISKKFQLISNRKFLIILVVGLLLGTVLSTKFYQFINTRPEATTARLHLYKVGWNMIRAHPILGVGINNHMVVAPEFDPDSYIFPMPTHNNYLFLGSEVGIPGLVFFLGFLFLSCTAALKAAHSDNLYFASVAVGIMGAFMAISVHNMVDHLNNHTNLTLFWLFGGLAAALNRMGATPTSEGYIK